MGEIADMMLEGDLCEMCGTALDGEGYGIPRYCSNECARDRGYDGIQSDGAGTYKTTKKKGSDIKCLSIRITYNGRPVTPDGKAKYVFHNLSIEEAKTVANDIAIILQRLGE